MAIDSDVVVIGGGLAGLTAAIAAADAGADTRLVTANQSTLRQASGLIDVLGYPPSAAGGDPGERLARGADEPDDPRARGSQAGDAGAEAARSGEGPIVDPFDHLPDVPEGHPYERVGIETVREALDRFDAVVDGYAGGHTDANALVPTNGGAIKPTARYPESTAAGLASDDRDALLVGFETLTDFDAPLAAAHLEAAGVPFAVDGVTVPFPGDLRADAKATRYAELLDEDEVPGEAASGGERSTGKRSGGGGPGSGGTGGSASSPGGGTVSATASSRAAVAERIRDATADAAVDFERVGFPAVLGEEHPAEVRAELAERLDAAVFEVPTGPPSLPGIRLEGQLRDALRERSVRVADGRPVVDYEAADGRIEHLVVEATGGSEVPHAASQVVLATGGLVGRGIDSARDRVREPIFDCHVPHPADRYEWFADDVFGDHPFAYFGVQVDRQLRPLDADGEPAFGNLRAAGAVLGGYDFAAEKSGAGVSIATGYAAGTAAAEEV